MEWQTPGPPSGLKNNLVGSTQWNSKNTRTARLLRHNISCGACIAPTNTCLVIVERLTASDRDAIGRVATRRL